MSDDLQIATPPAEQCAALAMELAPLLLRTMRAELNALEGRDLSVPQFRALRFVARYPGRSLSDLAEHLGMTLPAASKLIDRLLDDGLVARVSAPEDRRRVELRLTDHGRTALDAAQQAAQARLSQRLAVLPEEELERCVHALHVLRAAFSEVGERPPDIDKSEA